MHELSLATSLVRIARTERAARGQARPFRLGVKVGAIAGVDIDLLRVDFEALVRDTDLAGIELDIERVPHRRMCPTCRREFVAAAYDPRCPRCGDSHTELTAGDDLDITFLEPEDR
jgi:hydrogenase nickel incorporation protein HypA/HybF